MAELMRYVCKNPQKYKGDPRRITARSKWELIYMQKLDTDIRVAAWVSEPNLNITYLSPIDRRVHRYFPDFLIQYITNDVEIVEIKPLKEASLSEAKSQYDKLMLAQNIMKWKAAEVVAKSMGARFRVVTERDLFRVPTTRQTKKPQGTVRPKGTRK